MSMRRKVFFLRRCVRLLCGPKRTGMTRDRWKEKMKLNSLMMFNVVLVLGTRLSAQVQTELPPVVPGARPVTLEHIKVHGAALEGNLEGNAVDRDVLVFL